MTDMELVRLASVLERAKGAAMALEEYMVSNELGMNDTANMVPCWLSRALSALDEEMERRAEVDSHAKAAEMFDPAKG